MAVHVDPALPVHPLTVHDMDAMVRAGILDEDPWTVGVSSVLPPRA